MENKTIAKKIRGINATYNDISTIDKWIITKRGIRFSKRIGKERIEELERQFQAPILYTKDNLRKYRLYLHAIKKHKLLQNTNYVIIDYVSKLEKAKKDGSLKVPPKLSKKELYEINNPVIRDINGNPIQKTDKKGLKIWNANLNIPIYIRKNKNIRMELASKCHLYELHKMAKWDRRNPVPNSSQLCSELFPEIVVASYKTRRNIALESIRNLLSEKYYNSVQKKKPTLRLYSSHVKTDTKGHRIAYEVECDPYLYGYSFASCDEWLSNSEINNRLLKIAINHKNNDTTINAFKVYDLYGNLRGHINTKIA